MGLCVRRNKCTKARENTLERKNIKNMKNKIPCSCGNPECQRHLAVENGRLVVKNHFACLDVQKQLDELKNSSIYKKIKSKSDAK